MVDIEVPPDPVEPTLDPDKYPRRGGEHRVYGMYLGGRALDDSYCLTNDCSYKYTTQLWNAK